MTKYDFKRKRYGAGWTPVTIKGWFHIAIYLLFVVGTALILLQDSEDSSFSIEVAVFLLLVGVYTIVLIFAGLGNRPKMKWRWGKKETDNPDEDF